mmetsp:Transcript_9498/g.13909  ORF Transcript_9498/g.13909 Transcript_9498/m.13909 type:complete len:221 (-) Transcript_9498:2745-3407(-)
MWIPRTVFSCGTVIMWNFVASRWRAWMILLLSIPTTRPRTVVGSLSPAPMATASFASWTITSTTSVETELGSRSQIKFWSWLTRCGTVPIDLTMGTLESQSSVHKIWLTAPSMVLSFLRIRRTTTSTSSSLVKQEHLRMETALSSTTTSTTIAAPTTNRCWPLTTFASPTADAVFIPLGFMTWMLFTTRATTTFAPARWPWDMASLPLGMDKESECTTML